MNKTEAAMIEATYDLLRMNFKIRLDKREDVGFIITVFNGNNKNVSLKITYANLLYDKPSEIYKFVMNAKDYLNRSIYYYVDDTSTSATHWSKPTFKPAPKSETVLWP